MKQNTKEREVVLEISQLRQIRPQTIYFYIEWVHCVRQYQFGIRVVIPCHWSVGGQSHRPRPDVPLLSCNIKVSHVELTSYKKELCNIALFLGKNGQPQQVRHHMTCC